MIEVLNYSDPRLGYEQVVHSSVEQLQFFTHLQIFDFPKVFMYGCCSCLI
jgi:hypothetical protein